MKVTSARQPKEDHKSNQPLSGPSPSITWVPKLSSEYEILGPFSRLGAKIKDIRNFLSSTSENLNDVQNRGNLFDACVFDAKFDTNFSINFYNQFIAYLDEG